MSQSAVFRIRIGLELGLGLMLLLTPTTESLDGSLSIHKPSIFREKSNCQLLVF